MSHHYARYIARSVGESNAVFLRGVGGDAATEPHKTGFSGYPDEKFFRDAQTPAHVLFPLTVYKGTFISWPA